MQNLSTVTGVSVSSIPFGQPMNRPLARLLISASLANLSFLPVWNIVMTPFSGPYFLRDGVFLNISLSALLGASLLSLAYWIGIRILDGLQGESARSWAERAFLISLILPLNGLRTMVPMISTPYLLHLTSWGILASSAILLVVLACVVFFKWQRAATRAVSAAALIMSPFILVTAVRYVRNIEQYKDTTAEQKPSPRIVHRSESSVRLLWLVFDEMDQRLTFRERPAGLQLPNLDALKDQSLFATNAMEAASETQEAMPSLITGALVEATEPRGPSDLMLRYAGRQVQVPWSAESSVFTTARQIGLGTAAVGWYHPYCRVLSSSLDDCSWVPDNLAGAETGFFSALNYHLESILPFVARRQLYREQLSRYLTIKQEAERIAVAQTIGISLVHWPIPHKPFIFDARNRKYGWVSTQYGYFGNLLLVDDCLGDLRRRLEARGLWDQSVVLVTSDHSWRQSRLYDSKFDSRVPFILKLQGMRQGMQYDHKFNVVLTRGLLEGLMTGDLRTVEQITAWLDARGR